MLLINVMRLVEESLINQDRSLIYLPMSLGVIAIILVVLFLNVFWNFYLFYFGGVFFWFWMRHHEKLISLLPDHLREISLKIQERICKGQPSELL